MVNTHLFHKKLAFFFPRMPLLFYVSTERFSFSIFLLAFGGVTISYFACSVASVVSDSCNPMDCSLPGSSVHGMLQARILEWVAISFSRGSSQPRDWTCASYSSFIGRGFFTISATQEACFLLLCFINNSCVEVVHCGFNLLISIGCWPEHHFICCLYVVLFADISLHVFFCQFSN